MTGDAKVTGVSRITRGYLVTGLVRSRSRPGVWHRVRVTVQWLPTGEVLIRGSCDCEAFVRGHMPCWHILHLTNVFIRNRGRILRDVSPN
ncbi:SWIM zinc finger family protein [Vulcanisaeta thermophila]|uniref:SWIM zinc finger family protein n=1 Tax=Vulcanisaeta thermophila TaxID=867917 RepID=UPI0008532595|nr:SWIM zinc finger family protein [Vulcanisaeta thermophila]